VLALDNAAQTVGNLSSTFSATSSTTAGTYTQVITLNSTALTVDETGTTTFGNAIVSSSISQTSTIGGSGSVTLAAASTGALTFTGTQTYSGGTQVNGGALYMNGSLNGSNGANATVNVTEAGVLGGTGVIGGLVTGSNGGTITAGGAAGTIGELTLQNGLDLHAGGTFVWDLLDEADNSTGTAGTDFDQLELTGGALTLGGSSALTLDILSGSSSDAFWASNHTWTIINSSAALTGSGNFSQITDATYGTGTFTTTPDGSGDVTLNYTAGAVVPEPSAYACIALGGASLLAWGRRKRARRTE
jgi:autotransporter-associated beta strand protein